MTKNFLLILIVMSLLAVSCGKGGSSGSGSSNESADATSQQAGDSVEDDDAVTGSTDQEPVTPTTISTSSSLPSLALTFKTNVTYMNLTSTQKSKYNKAVEIVKKVVRTESFRTKVLNHKYGGVKKFVDNGGKTNSQIYQSILNAAEKLKPLKNNTMDLGVKMYYTNNSVVGYTNPSITYINVNTKFFNSYTANQVAGNLFHEWLHKLGYGHASNATSSRPYSVPYAIGYMVRDIGKSFL